MQPIRIFISSPGDVELERQIARRVLRQLQNEFTGAVSLEPFFWEYEPMRVTKDYTSQTPRPSSFDIVVCILWSRLGTPLGPEHRRPDGTTYQSGTEFEFEDAAQSFAQRGVPDVLVYRNRNDPPLKARPIEECERQLKQFNALEHFLERWTKQGEIITGALTSYSDLGKFEELLAEHLRKLILARRPSKRLGTAPRRVTWTKGSPFRGLEPFEFDHAPVFRGRTRAIQEVIDLARRQYLTRLAWEEEAREKAPPSFVLVSAMSGIGKSSLIRAGVLPLITAPGVIEGIGLWRRAVMKPTGRSEELFAALAEVLTAPDALPELLSDGTSPTRLAGLLRSSPSGADLLVKGGLSQASAKLQMEEEAQLWQWEGEFRSQGRSADAGRCLAQRLALKQRGAALVLFVDQLEEIFTTGEQGVSQERDTFLTAIDTLARSGRVFVLATLRSDFFARATESALVAALVKEGALYQLEPPTMIELAQIIRDPAREAGLAFEEDPESGSHLDDVLLAATQSDPAALPLLEFTLDQLYQRRSPDNRLTHAAYRELNGVGGALALRAEEEFAGLRTSSEAAFGRVFGALVNLNDIRGEERPVRRRASASALSSEPIAKEFISRFASARLLVLDQTGTDASVSVVHEALFSHWDRLRAWIEQNRDLLRIRARIEPAAARWQADGRPRDLLLPEGRLLAEAQDLLTHPDLVPADATLRAFVQESLVAQRGRRRRRVLAVASAVAGITIASMISWYQWQALGRNRIDSKLLEYRLAIRQAQSAFISMRADPELQKRALDAAQRVFRLSDEIMMLRGSPPESAEEDAARIYQFTAIERAELGDGEGAVRDFEARNALLAKMPPDVRVAAAKGPLAGEMDSASMTVFYLDVERFVASLHLKALEAQNAILKEALAERWVKEKGTPPPKEYQPKPQTQAENPTETLSQFAHFSRLFELLIQEFPTADSFGLLDIIQRSHAETLQTLKQWDDARQVLETRVNTGRKYLQWAAQGNNPLVPRTRKSAASTLADAEQSLADFYLKRKDFDRAISAAQAGLHTLEAEAGLEDSEDQRAAMRNILVNAMIGAGRKDQALVEAQRGVDRQMDFSRAQLQTAFGQTIRRYQNVERYWIDLGMYSQAVDVAQAVIDLVTSELNSPAGAAVVADLEDAYLHLSWNQLIAGQFAAAETTVRKGLSLFTAEEDQTELNSNLAHALLFQGRVDQAMDIYNNWKDKHITKDQLFAAAILQDFDQLKRFGIEYPEMPAIRVVMQATLDAERSRRGPTK